MEGHFVLPMVSLSQYSCHSLGVYHSPEIGLKTSPSVDNGMKQT